jgi:hypothetical protein
MSVRQESVKSNQEGCQSSDSQALPKTRSERSIDQWVFAKSKSEESMYQWSEISSDVESEKVKDTLAVRS